jgi:hypothetical protein
MNDSRFDGLLRGLANSRRSLVTSVLAAATGLLAAPGIDGKK